MKTIQKIVIANRGEIAVRIIKTAQKLGIETVAVYAADDNRSLHVSQADEAVLLDGDSLQETYLNQDKIIQIALKKEAQAIHPGYGFISENASFAEKVKKAGLIFVGATPEQIWLMGEKKQANQFVKDLGIPVIPSVTGNEKEILNAAGKIDFPVLVKASGGGGGKGMETVYNLKDLPSAMKRAQSSALKYFSNKELLVENFIPKARHIEVQVLGDGKGNAVHFFERECTVQRHYQKLIEEAPADSISPKLKEKLFDAALKIARTIKYRAAGTIEFLVDELENFYFLEMNTRLQVEHPVTELITGIDLVEWQFKIANGEQLSLAQHEIKVNGNAMELRICAEDASSNFSPAPGKVAELHTSDSARWDSFIQKGTLISPVYDSLTGKLIVHAKTRKSAIHKMKKSISELYISGIKTNQAFLKQIISGTDFKINAIHTRWVEEHLTEILQKENFKHARNKRRPKLIAAYLLHHFFRIENARSIWNQSGYHRMHNSFKIQVEGRNFELTVYKKTGSINMHLDGKSYKIENSKFNGSKIEFTINEKDIIIFISQKEDFTLVQYKSIQYLLKSNHVLNEVQIKKAGTEKKKTKTDRVVANLYGKVVDILVKPGDALQIGQDLVIIESMKSEITIKSPVAALVKSIWVKKGETVKDENTLVEFEY